MYLEAAHFDFPVFPCHLYATMPVLSVPVTCDFCWVKCEALQGSRGSHSKHGMASKSHSNTLYTLVELLNQTLKRLKLKWYHFPGHSLNISISLIHSLSHTILRADKAESSSGTQYNIRTERKID